MKLTGLIGCALLIALISSPSMAQREQPTFRDVTALCDSIIARSIADTLAPAVGVALKFQDSSWVRAYGKHRLDGMEMASADETLFQLGSVGKLLTAIAVLQQVEQGRLDLQADVTKYISDIPIENPFPTKLTLFYLLTHTSGLNDPVIGYAARSQSNLVPLDEHLKRRGLSLFMEPGKEINYSNYGYALAGYCLEKVTGIPYEQYVAEKILAPLRMTKTNFSLPDNYRELTTFAKGYRLRQTFEEVISYPRHATPAGSLISTTGDMNKLLVDLMAEHSKVISDDSRKMLFSTQFTNHPKLMGYSLGMEVQRVNGHEGFAKGGNIPGFLAEIVIFPADRIGFFLCTNTQTDNFFASFSQTFNDQVFGQSKPTPLPVQVPTTADGSYHHNRGDHSSFEEVLGMLQNPVGIYNERDVPIRIAQRKIWVHYQRVDSGVFQNLNDAEDFLVVRKDEAGNTRLYMNMNVGGFHVPASMTKTSSVDSLQTITTAYLLSALMVLTNIVLVFVWLWKQLRNQTLTLPAKARWTLVAGWVLLVLQMTLVMVPLFKHADLIFFEEPLEWQVTKVMSMVLPFVVLYGSLTTIMLWREQAGRILTRLYYTANILLLSIHLFYMWRWHLI